MPGYPCCCVAASCSRWLYFQGETEFEDIDVNRDHAGGVEADLYFDDHIELQVEVTLDPGAVIRDNQSQPASGCNCGAVILSAVLTKEDQCFRSDHQLSSTFNPGAAPWAVGAAADWIDARRRLECDVQAVNTIDVGLRQATPGLVNGRIYRLSMLVAADEIKTLAVFFHGFTPPGLPAQAIIHLDIPSGGGEPPKGVRVDATRCEAWSEMMAIGSPWFGAYRVVIDVEAVSPSVLAEIEIRAVNSFTAPTPPPLTYQGQNGDGVSIFSVALRAVQFETPTPVVAFDSAFCKHASAGCNKCGGTGACSFFIRARADCGFSTATGNYGWLNGYVEIGLRSTASATVLDNWLWRFRPVLPAATSEPFRFGDAVTLRAQSPSDLQRNVLGACYPQGAIGTSANNRATMAVVMRS